MTFATSTDSASKCCEGVLPGEVAFFEARKMSQPQSSLHLY